MSNTIDQTELRTDEELQSFTVGELERLTSQIEIVEYDPRWPDLFRKEAQRIRSALGDTVELLEHAGSTSVPGLAAKPKIDVILAVADSSSESAYIPHLERAGYTLRIREPEWYEHRVVIGPDYPANVHIFTKGCEEITRMLLFRDWLRSHDDDRELYEKAKLELASRNWKYVQHYADAKSEVVEDIIIRATAASAP